MSRQSFVKEVKSGEKSKSQLCREYGIKHPQTQGKEERFHRTMDVELLKLVQIEDMAHAQHCFDRFRNCYNTERPHEALGLGVPAEFYRRSTRQKPNKIHEYEYGNEYMLRNVKGTGYINFGDQGYFLSEAFREKTVAVRESSLENCLNVYFR